MPNRLLSSQLAAHAGTRQVDASLRADVAASAVDRAVGGCWSDLLALLKRKGLNHVQVYYAAHNILRGVLPAAHGAIDRHLRHTVTWGHRTASANIVKTLPATWLQAAAIIGGKANAGVERSSDLSVNRDVLLRGPGKQRDGENGRLSESALHDLGGTNPRRASMATRRATTEDVNADERDPGFVRFSLNGVLNVETPIADEPAAGVDPKTFYERLLFPPPDETYVGRVLGLTLEGQTWYQALDANARAARFGPDALAQAIAQRYSAGQGPREIAQAVLPFVDGVRYRARRTARTFTLAIASQTQLDAHEQIGELIEGYQVIATLDENTRPAHRHRNGTVYYKRPKQGQLGLDAAPSPPLEADGSLAWNCRCILAPVLRAPSWATQPEVMQVFRTGADRLVPDPATYADWFATANERRRRVAVGTRRYSAARDALGAEPSWEHFVDPRTGDMLSTDRLRSERPEQRARRLAKVRAQIDQRRELIRQVGAYGFTRPTPSVGVMPGAARLK